MAPAEVLNRYRCLRTPFGFVPDPGDLPGDCFLLISLSWGKGRPIHAFEASRRESRTTPQRSHLPSLPPSCACSHHHHPGSPGSQFHSSQCDYNGKAEGDGQAWHPGNSQRSIDEPASALFTSLHPKAGPELKLVSQLPLGPAQIPHPPAAPDPPGPQQGGLRI